MRTFLTIALIILISNYSCTSPSQQRHETSITQQHHQTSTTHLCPVTKIVDGDTFWVDDGSEKGIKIRFIGVDAPESRKTFKKEVGYYGAESKLYLQNLLSGRNVILVSDVDSLDRYGRTLSYVYLEDGTFVNALLVENGYATVMTFPPNVKFVELFVQLQQEAREAKRGLWGIEVE